jgi:tetratricopeptide (TPR) repeat protein
MRQTIQIVVSIPSSDLPAFFDAHPDLISSETVQALTEEMTGLVYADIAQAERVADAVEYLAGRLDERATADSLRCRGHLAYARGQYPAALEAYHRAMEILQRTGPEIDLGRTLSSAVLTLMYLGRYDEALEWASRAQTIFEKSGDRLRLGRLATNTGNILYRQDRYQEALRLYQESVAHFREAGKPHDVAGALANLAVCSISLSRFDEALAYYAQARDESTRHGLARLAAAADYNIAYLHYLRGDYVEAVALYRVSRQHSQDAGDAYHAALCDLDEAEMCLELNLNREAGDLARRAASAFETLGMRYEQAKAMVSEAIQASRRGDLLWALNRFRAARKLFRQERNPYWPALIDLYRAALYRQRGRLAEAGRFCERARRVLAGSPLVGKSVLCDLLRAQLLLDRGDYEGARRTCLKAEETAQRVDSPFLRFHARLLLGRAEELSARPGEAVRVWEAAREDVESLRGRLWSEDTRISFLKDKLAVYENLVAHSLARGEIGDEAKAFGFIQHAKSRNLADQIRGGERQQEWRDLNWHYQQLERLALSGGNAGEIDRLHARIRDLEHALGAVDQAEEPLAEVDLESIQAAIPPQTQLLEFYEVRGTIHVFVLDGRSLRVFRLAEGATVRRSLRLLQFQMSKFRLGDAYLRDFAGTLQQAAEKHLRELYRQLIEPIRAELNARHLIVAPCGALHHLPFQALLDGSRTLGEDFGVTHAPSAAVYALCKRRRNRPENRSLVLGISDPRAPQVEAEVEAVGRLLPAAQVAMGLDATDALLRRQGAGCRFIHIASHGLFHGDSPMFSSVQLGNGQLRLADLYSMSFNADLVTLSGCSTGLNAVVGGDELLGLLRGVLLAGARCLLVGLWDVNDEATAILMTHFYQGLADGKDKSDALRLAISEVRRDRPHPYFWAPFILAGDEKK